MKNRTIPFLLALFPCILFTGGCDLAQPLNKEEEVPIAVQNEPAKENAPPQEETAQDEDNTVTVKAEVGFGPQGHYGPFTGANPMEIITVPISSGFRVREMLFLQSIEHAINLYKAEHGRGPASNAEFMERIIRANNIKFPPLPPNQEFVYDPRDGQLKINKPKNAP